jgi:hypothetical protein
MYSFYLYYNAKGELLLFAVKNKLLTAHLTLTKTFTQRSLVEKRAFFGAA